MIFANHWDLLSTATTLMVHVTAVKPLLNDPQRKVRCINYLSTRDILKKPKFPFVLEIIHLKPPKEDKPLNKGQNGSINCQSFIVYSALYCEYLTGLATHVNYILSSLILSS